MVGFPFAEGTIQRPAPALILASSSTARAALLREAGLRFDVEPAAVDEAEARSAAAAEGASAGEAAMWLAEMKARRVSGRHPDAVVIGADQILVCEQVWFEKPVDLAAARQHLLALRGRTHVLATAVLCFVAGQRVWQHLAQPRLGMRMFSEGFVDVYLAAEGDRVLSSVGAYRLEGLGVHLFERIEGEHSAILGLPLLPLLGFLRQHGVLEG